MSAHGAQSARLLKAQEPSLGSSPNRSRLFPFLAAACQGMAEVISQEGSLPSPSPASYAPLGFSVPLSPLQMSTAR